MKKQILLTGSTDGIGKLAALKLAQDGHHVYVHGRNAAKLQTVIAEIKADAHSENVSGFVADFSDLSAVKAMAAQIKQQVPQLDVLINNAGVYKSAVPATAQGWDMRFTVNYLSPYLLTQELLPLLKKGEGARILNLGSAAQAPVSLAALAGKETLSTHEAYAQSKLALTMWSFHLAETEPDITTIAVNPGSLLNTNMVREGFGFHRSSADKGGDILYELATLPEYGTASGKYFDNDIGRFGTAHPHSQNQVARRRLLEQTDLLLDKDR